MNYPLISEYIEAIKAAKENFDELKNLRPVLDEDGEPVMTSGNFAVVFKMKDEQTGKLHAVKCFLKEQEGRAEAYRMIAEELESVNSTFLTPIKYLDKELFVDSNNSDETEFPVLLMDWVEGMTLDKYILEHIDDEYELAFLAYQFCRLAMWLMPQPFAHGDLKPDNILVKDDGTLVLVDYDGMYVPAMKGQKARELGSPDFRHPSRTEDFFDEHIDDFSLASILLSLKAISLQPTLLEEYGASDRLLFSEKDYNNINQCKLLKELYPAEDSDLNILLSLFTIALEKQNLSNQTFRLFNLCRPKEVEMTDEEIKTLADAWEEERAPYEVETVWSFLGFSKGYKRIFASCIYCPFTGGGENAIVFERGNSKRTIVYNLGNYSIEYIKENKKELSIELRKSGIYLLSNYGIIDAVEDHSTLISREECDSGFNDNEEKDDIINKSSEYDFSRTWPISVFAKLHGKMRVDQRQSDLTGETFTSLSFVDSFGREINAISFANLRGVYLDEILTNIGDFRIGEKSDSTWSDIPSYYYLYNRKKPFWLPGMSM